VGIFGVAFEVHPALRSPTMRRLAARPISFCLLCNVDRHPGFNVNIRVVEMVKEKSVDGARHLVRPARDDSLGASNHVVESDVQSCARSPTDRPSLRTLKLDGRKAAATDCLTVCLRTFELLEL
jgi:hypothetical protein